MKRIWTRSFCLVKRCSWPGPEQVGRETRTALRMRALLPLCKQAGPGSLRSDATQLVYTNPSPISDYQLYNSSSGKEGGKEESGDGTFHGQKGKDRKKEEKQMAKMAATTRLVDSYETPRYGCDDVSRCFSFFFSFSFFLLAQYQGH